MNEPKDLKIQKLAQEIKVKIIELFELVSPTDDETEQVAEWDTGDEASMLDEALHVLDHRRIVVERSKDD